MRNLFVVLSLICSWNPCLTWAADNKPLGNTEFQVFKAQTELKLDALKENQAKVITEVTKNYAEDINKQNVIIAAQDKRIGDLNLYLAIYAVIGGVLGILVAVAAYLSAGSKAREEARKEAGESAETWFNKNEQELLSRLKTLEGSVAAKAKQAHNVIDATEQSVVKKGAETARRMLVSSKNSTAVVSKKDKTSLNAADQVLKDKPESQYTFSDWNTRATASHANSNFGLAADFWGKAADTNDVTTDDVIMALSNKATMLCKLNQTEQALTIYDDLLNRFSASKNPLIQVLLSVVMANKGSIFLTQAKQVWIDTVNRKILLQKAISFFGKAVLKLHLIEEHYTSALGDIAYALWLFGRKDEAAVSLTKALQLGSEVVRDRVLDAAATNIVDADIGFVALVNKLWDELPPKVAVD